MLVQDLAGPHKGRKHDPGTARALALVEAGVAKPIKWKLPMKPVVEPVESLHDARARRAKERFDAGVAADQARAEERRGLRATRAPVSPEPAGDSPRVLARAQRGEQRQGAEAATEEARAAERREMRARRPPPVASDEKPKKKGKKRA